MPSEASVGSYVDVNLDTAAMNGAAPSQPPQKFVTFDDIPDVSKQQPFSAPEQVSVPQYKREEFIGSAPPGGATCEAVINIPDDTTTDSDVTQDNVTSRETPCEQYLEEGGIPQSLSPRSCLAMEPPKLDQIKKWTVTNYKFTKQLVSEKFGHSTKTVDKEIDDRISDLRVSKVQYSNMLKEARAMYTRYEALLTSHRNLRSQFQTMIAHAPELQDQLQANATTQSILEKNGEGLLGTFKVFVDTLNTLVNITMQDTLYTIKNYENARIEYDAYRNEIGALQNAVQTDSNKNKLLELQVVFEDRKQKWEKLKDDTHTKMNLLNENKLMVMRQQLDMFNSAVIAYFSGNGDRLSEVLSEYHIKAQKFSEEDASTKSFLSRSE